MIIGLMYHDESADQSTLKYSEVAEGIQTLGQKLRTAGWAYNEADGCWYFGESVAGESIPHRLETYPLGWSCQ